MLEINTIREFLAIPLDLQAEIQKAIKAKDRLEQFLVTLNQKALPVESHWEECRRCKPHWETAGQRGLVYVKPQEEVRDNRDIHPSQINKCLKALYYSCAGYAEYLEENVDPRLRMIFDLGHAWHDTIQRYGRLGAWGDPAYYHKEVPIDPDALTFDGVPALPVAANNWIRGSVDALLTRYEVRGVPRIGDVAIRLIHEYKTINAGQYEKLLSPKPEHKFQATIYSAVFDVPIVVYMYTNKDNCYIADFPVPFDTSIWNEISQKIARVQHLVNENTVPPWEETSAVLNQAECRECGYRKICAPPVAQAAGRRIA